MNMTLVDDIIKWFMKPKTIQGIAGMVVIIIVLALDFAYWAGAIDVSSITTGGTQEAVNETVEMIEVVGYHFEQEDTIIAPGLGRLNNDFTSIRYTFPVENNASMATIITTHTGNNIRPDVDLYVYAPSGEQIGSSADASAEEAVKLDDKDFERHGPGSYIAEVVNFSNLAITYVITIDVYYEVPANATAEEGE